MRLFYYRVTNNFGDKMNSWLWPRLLDGIVDEDSDSTLVGIGSLIKSDLSKVPGKKIIFGTGSGYGPMPLPEQVADWSIYCVRGPLTARLLRLPMSSSIVDAAWLIDDLPELRYSSGPREGTVFVPHWTTDAYANWRQPCELAGIRYISPMAEGHQVLRAIAGAKLAIVESLHGAIIADYYRVPWIPVATDGRVLSFKWLDFCLSIGVDFRPIRLPGTDVVEQLIERRVNREANCVEYLPVPHAEQFSEVPRGVSAPVTASYRLKMRLKATARPLRNGAVKRLQALRETALFRSAYKHRAECLASLLTQISLHNPTLSSDQMRSEKLEQILLKLHQLRQDYRP